MLRLATLVAVLSTGLLAGSVNEAQSQAAQVQVRASLRLVTMAPLTIKGTGFVRRETVRVTYRSPSGPIVRRVRASARGTFVAQFAVDAHPCSGGGTAVLARGDTGDVASLKLPQTLCPPPLSP